MKTLRLIPLLFILNAVLLSCTPPGPDPEPFPDMSLFMRWTVSGQFPDDLIYVGGSDAMLKVELWEDSDCDGDLGDGFYVYSFDFQGGVCKDTDPEVTRCTSDGDCGGQDGSCLAGAGWTGNYFFSGTPTCVQLVIVSESEGEDDILLARQSDFSLGVCDWWLGEMGWCTDYEECEKPAFCELTPHGSPPASVICSVGDSESISSCYELGAIDFDLAREGFGPLDVELTWEVEEDVFGACEEAGVAYLGFTMKALVEEEEDEWVYKLVRELDVADESPCLERLAWDPVQYGNYRLDVEGRNESGSILWTTRCRAPDEGDLVVDSWEEGTNSFECEVPRLSD